MKLFVDANLLSPYALSVYVPLRAKDLPFEMIPVDLQVGEQDWLALGRNSRGDQ